jgi:iron complex outermembrane recepter protein
MNNKLRFLTQTAAVALLIGADAAAVKAMAAETNPDAIETVIVTATKRETALQSTPLAVTAINSDALKNAHVVTVQDLVHLVPSFQATTEGDHGVITMTLRGIGNDTAKTEYADPEVATFVDGIYSPRPEGSTSMLFDMDNIQVLRGPQGTLWGRNSTTGVVNMVTVKPTLDKMYGDIAIDGGSYNKMSVRAAVNLPITDTFAVRIALAHDQHDGYVDFQSPEGQIGTVAAQETAYIAAGGTASTFRPISKNDYVTSGDKYSAQDQTGIRISGLWAPVDQFSWNLSLEAFFDRGTPSMSLMEKPRAGQKFWSALIDTAPRMSRDVYTIRSQMDYDINDYMSLSYIAGASRFNGSSDYDQDNGIYVPAYFSDGNAPAQNNRTTWSHYTNWSNEIQLKSSGNHVVDWIVGLYSGAELNGMQFDIPKMNGTMDSGSVGWQGSYQQHNETVDTKAAFGQVTWNVTDALHVTGGLRYTIDHRANHGGVGYSWAYNAACTNKTAINAGYDASTDIYDATTNPTGCWQVASANSAQYKGDKLTWLARVQYDINKDFMVYASVATGFKAGGTQDYGKLYQPETLTSYEVGTKNTLFDGTVTWNNTVYYYEFKNYQLQQAMTVYAADGVTEITHFMGFWNANSLTRAEGFETELVAKLSSDDMLQISGAIQGTRIGEAILGSNDYNNLGMVGGACPAGLGTNCMELAGHSMAHAPTLSVQIGYTHDFHLNNGAILQPRINMHIESNSWLSFFHDGSGDKQKGYTRTDLGLRYTPQGTKWYIEGYVQNAENAAIRTSVGQATSAGDYTAQYMAPRTFGAKVGVNF